jgi:hypothetical protein
MYPTSSDSPASPATKSKRSSSPIQRSVPFKKRKVVIQQRPGVRFNEEIVAHKLRIFKTPLLPSSTWWKEQDLSKIRDGVFSTLDAMKRRRDSGFDWSDADEDRNCSRGLEEYCIDRKGSLKASTIHRRQNAIRAVLHEQGLQVQRHKKLQARTSKQQRRPTPRHHSILDHVKLSRVYQSQTGLNIHDSISMGRVDSVEALAVYSERPSQPQQQQQQRRRHSLPVIKKEALATKPIAKNPETTWGFATTSTVLQPMTNHPNRPLRRIISVS